MKATTPLILILGLVLIGTIAGSLWFLRSNLQTTEPTAGQPAAGAPEGDKNGAVQFSFSNPKKSAHYESNTPAHAAVLPGVPVSVVIDFNFDLGPGSKIAILSGGTDYGTGATTIDNNKLALRRGMSLDAPDGLYMVEYTACWLDGSCHGGFFQFAIDRSLAAGFTDWRGRGEVTIDEKDLAFVPLSVRISQGTTVVWTNSDTASHYVNTDSHPAHTQFPSLNSALLLPGDRYSFRFDQPGVYPYHCSSHAGVMTGTILVE